MKNLHRLAIVMGVAEIALIAAAARRHAPGHRGRGCVSHDHSLDGPGRGAPHTASRRRPTGPPRHAAGGPPPWMRERLADWHRAQHATDGPEPDGPEADTGDTVDTAAAADRPDDT